MANGITKEHTYTNDNGSLFSPIIMASPLIYFGRKFYEIAKDNDRHTRTIE